MRVMGVVCALWSCGTEKCLLLFDFGRTCVRFRAEERTKERTNVWGSRIVLQTPKGMDACCHPTPKGGEIGSARVLSEVAGRSLSAFCSACQLIVLHSE